MLEVLAASALGETRTAGSRMCNKRRSSTGVSSTWPFDSISALHASSSFLFLLEHCTDKPEIAESIMALYCGNTTLAPRNCNARANSMKPQNNTARFSRTPWTSWHSGMAWRAIMTSTLHCCSMTLVLGHFLFSSSRRCANVDTGAILSGRSCWRRRSSRNARKIV